MSKQSTFEALEELLRLPAGSLKGKEQLKDLNQWDSLAMVEFVAMVDERFGIDILPEDVRECRTIDDLAETVASQIQ
jgi:acyl carrier protein